MGVEKLFSTKSRKRLHQILLPYRRRDRIYMVRARKKENKTNQAREWDNKTKRAGQGSEGVEHPLTFGYYVNIQIGK